MAPDFRLAVLEVTVVVLVVAQVVLCLVRHLASSRKRHAPCLGSRENAYSKPSFRIERDDPES